MLEAVLNNSQSWDFHIGNFDKLMLDQSQLNASQRKTPILAQNFVDRNIKQDPLSLNLT